MSEANKKQVGGSHYAAGDKPQHWDIVAMHDLDYFQGQITKYVMRWKKKNGLQDLQKAAHFLQKYIELNTPSPQEVMKQEMLNFPRLEEIARQQEEAYKNEKPMPMHPLMSAVLYNDENFQCEGYYGDGTELYKCMYCRTTVRAKGLLGAYEKHPQCVAAKAEKARRSMAAVQVAPTPQVAGS